MTYKKAQRNSYETPLKSCIMIKRKLADAQKDAGLAQIQKEEAE